MDFLRSWIQGIAFAAIISCIVLTLSPDGRSGKGVKTAVSIVLTVMFFSPFFKGDVSFRGFDLSSSASGEKTDASYFEMTSSGIKRSVEQKCRRILDENGINCTGVYINMETDESENTVNIKNIVVITDSHDTEKIKNMIENETGIPAVIKTEDSR